MKREIKRKWKNKSKRKMYVRLMISEVLKCDYENWILIVSLEWIIKKIIIVCLLMPHYIRLISENYVSSLLSIVVNLGVLSANKYHSKSTIARKSLYYPLPFAVAFLLLDVEKLLPPFLLELSLALSINFHCITEGVRIWKT